MSRAIIRVPDQDAGDARIHARGHQKRHAVFDLGIIDGDVRNDRVTDDRGEENDEHDDASEFEAIGDDGNDDGDDGCDGVGDHGPELCGVGGVA